MAADTCKNCGETIEVGYTICWKCGASIDGAPPSADFVPDALASSQEGAKRSLACLRCGTDMEFVRRMKLHEGSLLPGLLFDRSEEHTSELQSLMRISYAVFCLHTKIIYL